MEKIRSIHISDIHFGKKDDTRLYKELKKNFLDELIELEKEKHIDLIFIQGDLFERTLNMKELASNYVLNFIKDLCKFSFDNNCYLRIIKGTKSHDLNQLSILEHLEILYYENFKIINSLNVEELIINNQTIKILYIPEEYPTNIQEYYYDNYLNSIEKYDYIIGHGMIDIVKFNSKEQEDEVIRHGPVFKSKSLIENCKGVICFGHVHDFQEYKNKIFYTGSFSRFSFADQEDKGFMIFDYDVKNSKINPIFIVNPDAPTYKVVDFSDYEGLSTEDKIKVLNEFKEKYDYIKVRSLNDSDNLAILKEVVSMDDNIKMEVKNKIVQDEVDEKFRFILERKLSIEETIQRFIRIKNEKEISLDSIKMVLEIEEEK